MDPARTLVAAVMLLGAAWWDLRERRVPNLYWFPFVVFAAVFVALDVNDGEWLHLVGAAVVALLAYLFWRFGLWGGADAKGIMLLAFLVREHLHGWSTVAALDALVAGMALVLLWPLGVSVYNLVRGDRAFPALLIGVVLPIEEAKRRKVWPLQDVDGWRFRVRIGEPLHTVYRDLEQAGHDRVWVTPKLPTMAFILVGFLLVAFLGTPLAWLAP